MPVLTLFSSLPLSLSLSLLFSSLFSFSSFSPLSSPPSLLLSQKTNKQKNRNWESGCFGSEGELRYSVWEESVSGSLILFFLSFDSTFTHIGFFFLFFFFLFFFFFCFFFCFFVFVFVFVFVFFCFFYVIVDYFIFFLFPLDPSFPKKKKMFKTKQFIKP